MSPTRKTEALEVPNLQNPGYVSHLTLDLGSKIEKAERVVLTRHGAPGAFGGWDMQAMFAGDTALGVFWEPKEIKAGGKRLMQRSTGYLHTFASGVEVCRNGESTGATPGRLIRGAQPSP